METDNMQEKINKQFKKIHCYMTKLMEDIF